VAFVVPAVPIAVGPKVHRVTRQFFDVPRNATTLPELSS
jgi:hypothetical protein